MDLAREIAQLVFQKQKAQGLADKQKKRYKLKKGYKKKPNIRLRNWVIAMRRNFRDDEKEKALSQFTISRMEMHKVQNQHSRVSI
jgi:hypothetical protein